MARSELDTKHEAKYGGYRSDENKARYWLSPKQIAEFEESNAKIEKDEDFWKWFADFRKKHKLKESWWSSTRGAVSWEDEGVGKKKSYLSEWWADDYIGKKSGLWTSTSEEATKLALALSAIRTVIRVIDDSDPPMSVKWAEQGMSYTDFKNNEIRINPGPVKDSKLKDGDAIDIATAFAMHEASHATYTAPIWEQMVKPDPIEPLAVSSLMGNILEDIRIEANTSAKFPGFADYFEKGLDYLWSSGTNKPPKAYGPGLQDKVNFVIGSVKWPKEAEKLWRKDEAVELDWWQDWSARYQADKTLPLRSFTQEAINHLRIATEEEKKNGEADEKGEGKAAAEMDALTKKEEVMRRASSDFRRAVEKMLAEGGYVIMEYCPHPDAEDGLDSSEATSVERMVTEELRQEDIPVKMPNGASFADVFVTKPSETEHSRASYVGKPDPALARLKASLLFRQELPQYTNRLQREGGLDDEELWRWSAGDYRVFEEKVVALHPKVQMSLLVDMSGSMIGTNLRNAQKLAQLFVWALKDMPNVHTKVFGHTANVSGSRDCQVYRLWEPGDSMTRMGLINSLPHSNNYDGFAIASVAAELMERGDIDEQRVLIVLADGYPAGNGYGGSQGMAHVKLVDAWARKHGVEVIQIAIDNELDPDRQSAMFKQWIPFVDTASLPAKLERLLAKLT
jgi:hypothetical protein